MLVIGNFSNPMKPPIFAYVGDLTGTSLESKMLFLKGLQFLRHFKGKAVTKKHILEVLDQCSARTTKMLLKAIPDKMRLVTAADARGVHNHKVYCEDHRVSLNAAGKQFWAIDTKKIHEPIIEYTPDDIDELLDYVASVLDIDAAVPTEPAMKAAKWSVMYDTNTWAPNPRFAEGRAKLADAMSKL